MKFLDFLKEETTSADIATVDQRFPENNKNMIKRKYRKYDLKSIIDMIKEKAKNKEINI